MFVKLAVAGLSAVLFATLPPAVSAQSTTESAVQVRPPTGTGKISGVAFDSLLMTPMANVQVWVVGSTVTTNSDFRGKFELNGVPEGVQTLAYSSVILDSVGVGTRGLMITVEPNKTVSVNIGTPSGATLWRVLCANKKPVGSDSGIAWGSVSDAHTGKLLRGAPVLFGWYDMDVAGKTVNFSEVRTEVVSDSTGTYYACGLPTNVALASQALGDSAASGEVQFQLGERYSHRVDLTVSRDLFSRAETLLGAVAPNTAVPKGTATLRGTVSNDKGVPIAGVTVALSTVDTVVRTAANGTFQLTYLPSGTLGINARSVGYASTARLVDLRPDAVTEVNFTMGAVRDLATFNVRAERKVSLDEAEFLERRKTSTGGHIINMQERGFSDAIGPLRNIPRVRVVQSREGPIITMTRPGSGNNCVPVIYVNGARVPADQLTMMNVDQFTFVEVYTNWMQVPPRFLGAMSDNPCGVVLYWTRFSLRK